MARVLAVTGIAFAGASLSPPAAVAQHDHEGMAAPAAATEAAAESVYEKQISPDFDAVKTAYDPKHTPKITAPETVTRGEWFDVTIEIGQGGRHPSLVEHHVRWIALYRGDVELARAYLHPVSSSPKVTFTVRLEEDATLRALEEPTHTAAWESSHDVKVQN